MSKWLAPLGYRLEMRTARAMHKAGLDVRCSDYYIDPEIGKARKLDVAACRNVAIGEMLNRQVRVLIECKAAKSWQQWVGFCSVVVESPALVPRVASSQGQRWLELLRFKIVPGETAVSPAATIASAGPQLVATWQNGAVEQRDTADSAVKGAATQRRPNAFVGPRCTATARLSWAWLSRSSCSPASYSPRT